MQSLRSFCLILKKTLENAPNLGYGYCLVLLLSSWFDKYMYDIHMQCNIVRWFRRYRRTNADAQTLGGYPSWGKGTKPSGKVPTGGRVHRPGMSTQRGKGTLHGLYRPPMGKVSATDVLLTFNWFPVPPFSYIIPYIYRLYWRTTALYYPFKYSLCSL